ncbi:DUF4148 domain-containing protein [Burkholderia gladioli]|jgi:hypothetical protein|uniref:DUF4148 domain-containing protein n=1 Tax=Burkholderia gladioli TaxID=28095 RepID=UPI001364C3F5|nr:DUF4148 domain-containing protein [Burkholderia gladioli]KAF1064987.1 hypothetical protein LvStA_03660 [Burkholderia gladioli]MDN7500876.1 DUF4148 domain-containing protein [Burkholderia gladioli]MDN7605016.1 DUF4148 domain-containing protein [Burkholderia gladioli]NRF88863.1 DUF4148 domain-containing protein [Burkholderia gladioli]WAG21099.1 DUF4148 domain-containing protein [Burkholderia gladioli]
MKKSAMVLFAMAALVGPTLSFAQSTGALTRAQVRAELIQLERAGYDPAGGDDANYPEQLEAAEAKVAAQERGANQALGSEPATRSEAGLAKRRAPRLFASPGVRPSCVGPASFCDIYFGG